MTFTYLLRRIYGGIVVFGLTLAVAATPAAATTYYVSPSGNDADPGTTPSQPWQTIGKVNSATFASGDFILFEGGESFSGNLSFTSTDAGTSASPVTVSSYGSGRATINAGSGTGIQVKNAEGFNVTEIDVIGSGPTTNGGNGIDFVNDLNGDQQLSYARISHVEVHGFGISGVMLRGAPSDGSKSGWNDVRIEHCVAYDNQDYGIYVTGYYDPNATTYANSDVYVGYCEAYENTGDQNYHANHTGSGIILEDVDGGVVEYSVAHDNGVLNGCSGCGPVGIWAAGSNDVTLQYNESYANSGGFGGDGDGFDFDGGVTNSTMQYNYSHDNEGAGYLLYTYPGSPLTWSNNVIRYNISSNDGRLRLAGIYAANGGSGVAEAEIYGNTIYTPSGTARPALELHNVAEFHIRNNVFVTTDGVPVMRVTGTNPGLTLQGNDYWASGASLSLSYSGVSYATLAAFQSATGHEMVGPTPVGNTIDPQFIDISSHPAIGDATELGSLVGPRLRPDSPLVDIGLDLDDPPFNLSVGPNDLFGGGIPDGAGFDIGANELQNLAANPGFETGTLTPWGGYGTHNVITSNVHGGSYAIQLGGSPDAGVEQIVPIEPDTTYAVVGYGKVSGSGDTVYVGAKDFGGTEVNQAITDSTYSSVYVTFTTGPSATTADVYFWKPAGSGTVYGDDLRLVELAEPPAATNLVANPGFEQATVLPWTGYGSHTVSSAGPRSGAKAIQLSGSGDTGVQQSVTVLPNTTYTLSAWGKAAPGGSVYVGVLNYGGPELNDEITSTTYSVGTVTFTTGSSTTTADVYLWKPAGSGTAYGDDFALLPT